jgi:anti-anti-sigma factor
MNVSVEIKNGVLMVTLNGMITHPITGLIPGFKKILQQKIDGVIMDLASVDFINSIGISAILESYKFFQSKGIPMLICSANPQVLKVLKLSRTDIFIPIVKDYFIAKMMFQNGTLKVVDNSREHILVIQHNLNIRSGLKDVLKQAKQDSNYIISTAINVERGWEFLEMYPINIIILDVTNPYNQIQAFIERVRCDKAKSGIPIFVASDEKNLFNASYHTRNGADDIMLLPFNQFSTPTHIRTGLALYNSWKAFRDSFNHFDRLPEYA